MAEKKERPVHVQVAEAGFGAAVEAKGFRQVGRTHWRLDGDGIVHHLMLRPGPRGVPGSFRDFEACFFPEVEELCRKCDVRSDAEPLPLGKGLYHMGGFDQIAWHDYWHQKERYEAENPEVEQSFWEYLKARYRNEPPPPKFDLHIYRPPLGWKWDWLEYAYRDKGEWRLNDRTVEDVACSVTDAWEATSWPYINARRSWQSYYEKLYRAWIEDREGIVEEYIIYAHLGGDHHLIQQMIDREAELVRPPVEEVFQQMWKDCVREVTNRNWKRYRHTPEGLRQLRGRAMGWVFSPLHSLREAKRITDILGVDVRMPDVDYTEYDTLDREAYRNKPYDG